MAKKAIKGTEPDIKKKREKSKMDGWMDRNVSWWSNLFCRYTCPFIYTVKPSFQPDLTRVASLEGFIRFTTLFCILCNVTLRKERNFSICKPIALIRCGPFILTHGLLVEYKQTYLCTVCFLIYLFRMSVIIRLHC